MIIQKFEEQVERFAGKTAVITGSKKLTYEDVNRYANRVAVQIQNLRTLSTLSTGGQKKQIVGLLFEHSADMVVAVLGTLKAGKAYLPLDITYPENRLAYMLEDSGTYLLLTNTNNFPLAQQLSAKVKNDLEIINIDHIVTGAGGSTTNVQRRPSGDGLAYILYTSGSTGKPKGVMQNHENVCYYIRNWTRRFSIGEADRMTLFSAFSHDGAGQDMFGALHNGAVLYPYNILTRPNAAGLIQWLKEEKITIWHSVPTLYRYFINALEDRGIDSGYFPHLRFILLGGEQVIDHDIRMFKHFFPNAVFANVYGQTESSVDTIWLVRPQDPVNKMLLGDPLDKTEIFIMDKRGEILEDMGVGEIIVACDHISPGYWNHEQGNKERFSHDPELGRLYRTGDLGRLLANGSIEFMGRKDAQVKIRGFRVETGEIETGLLKHDGIKEAVVSAKKDEQGNTHLCAYFVAQQEPDRRTGLTVSQLRDHLSGELPEYMIPSYFIPMDALPLTPNGKVDRKKLPDPEPIRPRLGVSYVAPQTALEKEISNIWREVLNLDRVGVDDSFFDLGGTSFDVMKVNSKLYDVLQEEIPVIALFQYPTIRSFVRYLGQEKTGAGPTAAAARETAGGKGDSAVEIAVIGMSCRFPGSRNVAEFWENLKNGVETIGFYSGEELQAEGIDDGLLGDPDFVKAKGIIGEVDYFDAAFFNYSPSEARAMDPQLRILHECSWEALEDGGCDPDSYPGRIGLYAGNANNSYWITLAYLNNISAADMGFLGSNYSTIVSYRLNLRGPSFIVQCACSTSLVAIHLACRALIEHECDMALAGGVSIRLPERNGYIYREGLIHSPDGHCRTFDARAGGTVFGNGAGIVLLKRLADAVADGDTIDAVVKGSGINNDGRRKVGLASPSVEGQAEIIGSVYRQAGIDPGSIGYVEAHGTGTVLGDPVEIEALKLAFNTAKKGYCRIGAAKTNVGHLNIAAGVTGFIKTVLVLKHRMIPPSLYFETPNPRIDFENSPFVVNHRLSEWKRDKYPLRAGVSSFGIGGTNAHAVLEEAPAVESSSKGGRLLKMLLLSAASRAALEKASRNLGNYLKENPGINLADVAYTLQAGRKAFKLRKMLLCSTMDEAVKLLLEPEEPLTPETGKVHTAGSEGDNRPVVFMFPGQGAQYVNMGLELYRTEPVFRMVMDRCFEILNTLTDDNIKETLYPAPHPDKSPIEGGAPKGRGVSINQTSITQPVLFIFEYTLARLLLKWGITPYAMIGHSIGEYVAACLSGVLSLEDAMKLVVLRGKCMQRIPGGSMLGVPLPQEKIVPLLRAHKELSLAAVNTGSACVVSGPHEAVGALEKQLKAEGHNCRRLHTSHAFHSAMMDPILTEFAQTVKEATLNEPLVPYLSNVTGQWITAEEAKDPAYWAKHLRSTVRFGHGLAQLLKEPETIFIEVGPGRTLSSFVRQHDDKKPGQSHISLVRHPKEEVSDGFYLLSQMGRLWLKGKTIDWRGFYSEERRQRIHLPSYPFQRQRYRLEGNPYKLGLDKGGSVLPAKPLTGKNPDIAQWFYIPTWKPLASPVRKSGAGKGAAAAAETFNWLLFIDTGDVGPQLAKRLKAKGHHVVIVGAGAEFSGRGDNRYTINPGREEDYDALIGQRCSRGKVPQRVVHLWNLSADEGDVDRTFYSFLYLARAIGRQGLREGNPIVITAVTDGMQAVGGTGPSYPQKALIMGPLRVIPREYPGLDCRGIDIPGTGTAEGRSTVDEKSIDLLLEELLAGGEEKVIAFRDNQRWVQEYEPHPLANPGGQMPRLKEKGVYLVTGGLGGIGLVIAGYLAKTFRARLVLTGRTPLPPRGEWDRWLASHDRGDAAARKINGVRRLEEAGAEVLVLDADAADMEQMREVIRRAQERFGKIDGVIHSAGVADGGLIQVRKKEMSQQVLTPKVQGTLVLDTLLEDTPLDFFMLCSSISAVTGPIGQVAYCAANVFMDGFAPYKRAKDDTFTVSVNWDAWQEVGMAVEAIEKAKVPSAPAPAEIEFEPPHPLFTACEMYNPGCKVFISHLSVSKHWVLDEHRILGKATLPGTAYLEMAAAAFERHTGAGAVELADVYFLTPLTVADDEEREVRTILQTHGTAYTFSIASRVTPGEDRWVEHARGKAAPLAPGQEKPGKIAVEETAAIHNREKKVPRPGKYNGRRGAMTFGPRWDNLGGIKSGVDEAAGFLELPGPFSGDIPSYKLHPALLDNAATLLRQTAKNKDKDSYMPFFYKRLKIKGGLPGKIFCRAGVCGDGGPSADGEFLKFDITIADEGGRELVEIEEFTLKRVAARAAHENFSIGLSAPGSIDNLVFKPAARAVPKQGEVEIEVCAAGLNFKEVLTALGALGPTAAGLSFGMECAGRISALGPGVDAHRFKIGDEVVAFGSSCFSPYITTPAFLVVPKPAHLSFEEAASIPVAFMTAYHSLVKLAGLGKNQRVLIHSAAGGVGLAAVEIARWLGAEIFATAGNREKRDYLHSLGIQHTLDSKTTDFVDEILKRTAGKGVDVVLNSLAGEKMTGSLSVLAPFGRFLEIGIRDMLADTPMGLRPFLKGLSYFAVYLSPELPDIENTWVELMGHFENRTFKPIPLQVFPVKEVAAAFDYMTKGRHMGKIVLSHRDGEIPGMKHTVSADISRPFSFFLSADSAAGRPAADDSGISRRQAAGALLQDAILPEEGIDIFQRVLAAGGLDRVLVSTTDLFARTGMRKGPALPGAAAAGAGTGDRSMSRHARPELGSDYVAPQTTAEKKLAPIWEELLAIEEVGIYDDFFELGGDSLKAVNFGARIHKYLNCEVPISEFFNRPNIKMLAQYIEEKSGINRFYSIKAVEKKDYYALSPVQRRLYVLHRLEGESLAYNLPGTVLLQAGPGIDKIEETFRKLIARHESLRTSFAMIAGEPVQRIHDRVEFNIEYYTAGDGEHGPAIAAFVRPFDLSKAPLLRGAVVKIAEAKYLLTVDFHHTVCDGVSFRVFYQEFTALYNGEGLPPLKVQYRDYTEWKNSWQQTAEKKKQEGYWLDVFTGEIPVAALPLDYPRPAPRSFAGRSLTFIMDKEETALVKALVKEEETTLFILLLAVLNVLLLKLCGQEDIIVGTPAAGRGHTDLEPLIGVFVNTLAMRNFPTAGKDFASFLGQMKQRTLGAFENGDYPFEDLVDNLSPERDLGRNPIFDVMFILHSELQTVNNRDSRTQTPEAGDELEIKPYRYEKTASQFDLVFACFDNGDRLLFDVDYCTELFKEASVRRFTNYFKTIAAAVSKDPRQELSGIEIMSAEEKKQLLYEFNDTAAPYPHDKTIHELFAGQAATTPDSIAVIGNDAALSYKELSEKSDRLARLLRTKGVMPGKIVGIMVGRSVEMMVGLLGILKAGAAYLPIDPAFPQERIDYMLAGSGTKVLVTTRILAEEDRKNFGFPAARLPGCPAANPAYVIYTSGSTGSPKGVIIGHRNVVNFINGMTARIEFSPGKSILALTTISFDIFLLETLLPVTRGMTVVIADENQQKVPALLEDVIVKSRVNMLQVTPSRLQMLSNPGKRGNLACLEGVEQLLVGGEALPHYLFKEVKERFRGKFYNVYGPTETTIWSTVKDLSHSSPEALNIGTPIANTQIYIVDGDFRLQPLGVAGELLIGGDGAAAGYLNNVELTAEKFIENPVIKKGKKGTGKLNPLYKTGDLARRLANGEIEFLGRLDQQVKIRGFRVELEEIEEQLLKQEIIEEAVVVMKTNNDGDKSLCAYIVIRPGEVGPAQLRETLSAKLPSYMIPSYFVPLEKIPLTPNGKIDRKALPEPVFQPGQDYVAPASEIEMKLAAIWAEILGLEKENIGVNVSFFELGGHSLRAINMLTKIHEAFNVRVDLTQIFKTPTIKGLSECITGAEPARYAAVPPVEEKEYYPLSTTQKRLYMLQQMNTESAAYNLPNIVVLEGEPDRQKLAQAFIRLISRHEGLRTSFITIEKAGGVVQKILEPHELKAGIAYDEMAADRVGDKVKNFIRPFHLDKAPLLRLGLIKTLPAQKGIVKDEHILMLDIHHIITDGTSHGLFIKELMLFYKGEEKALCPLKVRYRDYSEWQNKRQAEGAEFWLKELAGEIPPLNLPLDFARPDVQRFEGHSLFLEINAGDTEGLRRLALEQGVSLFVLLLALFTVLTAKITGREDISIGTQVAGRRKTELQHIIGVFINTLVLRNYPRKEKSFNDFLKEIMARTLNAFENQGYPFEDLADKILGKRELNRNPLFDVMFVWQNMEAEDIRVPGLTVKPYREKTGQSRALIDLTIYGYDEGEKFTFFFEYNTSLFKQETIERFIAYFKEIVSFVLSGKDVKIEDIRISHRLASAKSKVLQESDDEFGF